MASSGSTSRATRGKPQNLPAQLTRMVRVSMAAFAYRFELRRGEEVISTGHLTQERALEVGERIEIAGELGIVRAVEPLLGERELRLVVQLWREGVAS